MAEAPTRKIGKYEVLEELGRGAMGVVYKARDPFIGRLVALKTITPGLLDNPELLKRFYREAQAAGGLQHPNIVTIFDLGEADGLPYIAMEFLEGESLEKVIARQPLMPLAQKLNLVMQLCRGLGYAHQRGVVHRDIKPGNIIVKKDGTVKVVDFGIVRLTTTSMTSTGMVIGTVGYMSPEQVRGEHVDQRSDLFSVGVVAYEFFAYKKPFFGPNVTSVLLKIVGEEPPPLSELAPQVPPNLEEVVHKCLRKDPEERFQSLEDLVLEVEPIWRSLQHDMVTELVNQGQGLFEKKEFTKAREVLREALVLDSSHGLAKGLMAKVTTELKRTEVYPKIQKHLESGEGLLKDGKYEEAAREFEEILKLDTQHGQAQEMLEAARKEMSRSVLLRQSLSTAKQALGEGDLTTAQSELEKIFAVDEQNVEAKALLGKLHQEQTAREKRARLLDTLRQGRSLLIQQRHADCIKLLEDLEKEFPGEAELEQLLRTAREEFAEQKKAQVVSARMDEARHLLRQQEYKQALTGLDELLKTYPGETAAVKLRDLVVREQQEAEKAQQYEQELAGLQKLVEQRDFPAAVERGQRLHKQFPDDTEISRLLAHARAEHQLGEQQAQLGGATQAIQELLAASKFDQAIREAEKAVKKFPGQARFTELLSTARKRKDEATKRADLERRLRSMKGAIERGDLTDAIDLGRQTLAVFPKDTDATQLLTFAQQEYQAREKKKQRDETLKTAVMRLESKDFDGATVMLKDISKEFPFDEQVKTLLTAAKAHEIPPDAATIIGGPLLPEGAGAPGKAGVQPSAETTYVWQGPGAPPPTQPTPAAPAASAQAQAAPGAVPEVKPVLPPPPPRPEVKPVAPPPVAKPAVPAPAVKPAPVEAPPAVKPIVRPPVAPPVEVPEAVPFWKKPAVIGMGAVLVVGLAVGGYFMTRTSGPTEQETQLRTQAQQLWDQKQFPQSLEMWKQLAANCQAYCTEAQQQVSTIEGQLQQEKQLYDQAEQFMKDKKYGQAKESYQKVVQLNLSLRTAAEQGLQNAQTLEAGGSIETVAKKMIDDGRRFFNARQYDQAERTFQSVANLPGAPPAQVTEARRYIQQLIPPRKDEENLWAQVQPQAQASDKGTLEQAKGTLQRIVGMRGGRQQEAQQLLGQVEGKLKGITDRESADAEATARERERQGRIATLKGEIEPALRNKDFTGARQKADELRGLGEDTTSLVAQINQAEEAARPKPPPPPANGGTTQPSVVLVGKITPRMDPLKKRTQPVSAGQTISQPLLDSELRMTGGDVPQAALQGASPGSSVQLFLTIDERGKVASGRAMAGDTRVAQAVLQAAQQNWQFTPPTADGKAVKTTITVRIDVVQQ